MQFVKERMQPQTACPWLHANILVHSGGWAFGDGRKFIAGMLDTQVLDLMLWCKETLLNVLQHQQALRTALLEQDTQ